MALELSHSKIAVCGQRTPCHSVRESMAEGILGKKRSLSRQIGTSRVPNYTVPLRTRAVWKAYLFINYLWNTFKEVPCTSSSSMDSWGLGAQKDPRDPILQCYKFPDEKHQRSERSEWMTRLSSAVVAMTTWESRFSTPGPVLFPPCQPACCIDRWCDHPEMLLGRLVVAVYFPTYLIYEHSLITGTPFGLSGCLSA